MTERKTRSSNSKKYKFIYQTKNLINGKTYIGYHCTDNLEDGYIGCGCYSYAHAKGTIKYGLKSAFLRSIIKYGYENFNREILSFYDTVEECLEEESFLVNKKWVNLKNNYNTKIGGLNSGYNLLATTEEEDNNIFKDFMRGITKEEITKKYNISESVIYRITKDKDTSKRIINPNKSQLYSKVKIDSQKDSIIKRFLDGEDKSSINRSIDFDLFKSKILKDIKKYVAIDMKTEEVYFFNGYDDMQNIPRMNDKNMSYIKPTLDGKQSHSLGYFIVKYNDYLKGITTYWSKEKKSSKYSGQIIEKDGKDYVLPSDLNDFCKQQDLFICALQDVLRGSRKHHKNFKLKIINGN